MALRIDLTFDCADAVRQAAFWRLALGYEDEPAPPPFATREEWLRHYEVPEEEWDDGAWLRDPDGIGPRVGFLRVPEGKVVKNRLHPDLRLPPAPDAETAWAQITAKVAELTAAGGSVLAEFAGHHVVMADPEGNEFCVAQGLPVVTPTD